MSGVAICLHCQRARIVDVEPDPICERCMNAGHAGEPYACDVCEQERIERRMRIDALVGARKPRCAECAEEEEIMRRWGAD